MLSYAKYLFVIYIVYYFIFSCIVSRPRTKWTTLISYYCFIFSWRYLSQNILKHTNINVSIVLYYSDLNTWLKLCYCIKLMCYVLPKWCNNKLIVMMWVISLKIIQFCIYIVVIKKSLQRPDFYCWMILYSCFEFRKVRQVVACDKM